MVIWWSSFSPDTSYSWAWGNLKQPSVPEAKLILQDHRPNEASPLLKHSQQPPKHLGLPVKVLQDSPQANISTVVTLEPAFQLQLKWKWSLYKTLTFFCCFLLPFFTSTCTTTPQKKKKKMPSPISHIDIVPFSELPEQLTCSTLTDRYLNNN